MYDLTAFKNVREEIFPKQRHLLLNELREKMLHEKPFKGLSILLNVPLTLSTLLIVDIFCASRAIITVTNPPIMSPDEEAKAILKKAGVKFESSYDFQSSFDIYLDCCGELYGKFNPRIGAVELTGSGDTLYREKSLAGVLDYPVISVNDSKLKEFETLYGTGDGFIRAFKLLIAEDFRHKKFVLFGYGKVGKGVVKALRAYTNDIVIIEKNNTCLQEAASLKLKTVLSTDSTVIANELNTAYAIITATGVKNIISEHYPVELFKKGQYLANIGAEDEFGERFADNEVLNKKRPINFILEEPTKLEYLDPIFSALISAAQALLIHTYKPRFHPFPKTLDDNYVKKWKSFYKKFLS